MLRLRPTQGNILASILLNNSENEIQVTTRANDVTILFTGNDNNMNYGITIQDVSNRKIVLRDNSNGDDFEETMTIMNAQIDLNAIRSKYQNN